MVADPASQDGPDHEVGPAPGLAQVAAAVKVRSRWERLWLGLWISVLTVVAIALLLEGFLRLTDDRQKTFDAGVNRTLRRWLELTSSGVFEEIPDHGRRYAMRPGAECEVDGWTFRISSHRTRGADFPAAKPPGEKRILALGDSFCFGMWSDEDETLVGHLTRMANEREAELGSGITWRAVNLGVPGYHSRQQLLALEQDGFALDPDLVLLYYNTNDIERPGFFYDEDMAVLRNDYAPLPIPMRRWLWHSHLYGFLTRRYTEALTRIPLRYLDERVPYAWVREDNQRDTRAAIAAMKRLCDERGVPLAMVNQPLMTWSGDARNPDWPVLPVVRWAEELRAELALPGIDLLGWMRGYADGVDRFPAPPDPDFLLERYFAEEKVQAYFRGEAFELPEEPDFHLTGAGYGHMARVSYPALQAAGLLP